jgi:hypothetical protein
MFFLKFGTVSTMLIVNPSMENKKTCLNSHGQGKSYKSWCHLQLNQMKDCTFGMEHCSLGGRYHVGSSASHLKFGSMFLRMYDAARGSSLANPTIQPRLYGRGEMTSYTIVQHFPSFMRAMAACAACSCSGAVVPVGPADASEGEIRAVENCVATGNWTQDLGCDTMLEDPPQPIQPYNPGYMEGARWPLML